MLSVYYPMISTFISTPNLGNKPLVNDFKYYGDIKPTGFFDPLKLSTDKNSKYLREFELQHSRVAMVSSVFIPLYEYYNPGKLGTDFLFNMDLNDQLPFWYIMGLLEFGRLKTGWVNPFTNKQPFTLKDDFQPGNYLNYDPEKVSERLYNTELSNGRLAMLAAGHMLASELVSGNPLF